MSKILQRHLVSIMSLVAVLSLCLPTLVHARQICAPLESRHGNNDYLDPGKRGALANVERVHFNENVRMLRGGARGSGSTLRGDLEYTLNWFPNHHVALDTLVRWVLKVKNPQPRGAVHIDCRFQWANQVNPRDGMVHMLDAQYRYALGEHDQVRALLEKATTLSPHDANVQYNAGLLHLRMKNFEAARVHARRAYELGFPLPGLRNLLAQAGHPVSD